MGFRVGSLSVELNHRRRNFVPVATGGRVLSPAAGIVGVPQARDRISLAIADRASASSRNQRSDWRNTPGERGREWDRRALVCVRACLYARGISNWPE